MSSDMRFAEACTMLESTLLAEVEAIVQRLRRNGTLDAERGRALQLESRLNEMAWQTLAKELGAASPRSQPELIICVAQALVPFRAAAPLLPETRPVLLGRVQKSNPLSKRAGTSEIPLVSRRRAHADIGRMLRAESPFSDPMWGTFDTDNSRRDPFAGMDSAREVVCRLALGWTDNPREVWIILYELPPDIDPKMPILAHAVSLPSPDGRWQASWHRYFQPAPLGARFGRTRPVLEFRCEKGMPEIVHDPVPFAAIKKIHRLSYA